MDGLDGFENSFAARDWLVNEVKGYGFKEASHFLRNIGLGEDLAILDRHILKNLARVGVIDEVPSSMTEKNYKEIEEKMKTKLQNYLNSIEHEFSLDKNPFYETELYKKLVSEAMKKAATSFTL